MARLCCSTHRRAGDVYRDPCLRLLREGRWSTRIRPGLPFALSPAAVLVAATRLTATSQLLRGSAPPVLRDVAEHPMLLLHLLVPGGG